MITWDDFNFQNKHNKQTAFENMTRIFFNYYFFDNKAILKQKHNNPGVEVEPIKYKGKKISFQSKYIESDNIYTKLKESLKNAVSNYSGDLDVIYIFSNKDVDPDSESYKKLLDIVTPHNITLERFCNESILSTIETKNYQTIKHLFFTPNNVNNKWLNSLLKTSLEDLEPRYVSGFNVDVDIQKYFDLKYISSDFSNLLDNYLKNIITKIKDLNIYETKTKLLCEKIKQLPIPNPENIFDIFSWHLDFESDIAFFSNQLESKISEIKTIENFDKKQSLYSEKYKIEKMIEYIRDINLNSNSLFSSIKTNCLLIEGDAGIGKSHLLGYEAEKYGNNFNRTILLLGQKFISNNSPFVQIKEQLGISYDIDTFLDILEGLGEVDNSSTIIMIDALNECAFFGVWQNFLNLLISKILNYKHIKFVGTVRSTYKDIIFSDIIKTKISNNEIVLIKHTGFDNILDEAVTKFFNYYKIPLTSTSYIAYEYNNPLLLKLYCMSYNKNENRGFQSINSLFKYYINEEEKKVKLINNDISQYPYFNSILKIIGYYLFNNQKSSIELSKVYEICNSVPNSDRYITYLLKSKILVSYCINNCNQIVYFGYERMSDFIIAECIVENLNTYNDVSDKIKNELLKTDDNGYLVHFNTSGIFSALSIIICEQYNKEIINFITEANIKDFEKYQIIEDYLHNLVYRKDEAINKEELLSFLFNNPQTIAVRDAFFNTLLKLAGRLNNKLNAHVLHEYLMPKTLSHRDVSWTTFINDNFYQSSNLFRIINYFENNEFSGNTKEKELFSIMLTWMLTSSNRSLRDRTSRCLVKLLENDVPLINKLFLIFKDVNDPYVLQRLFGIFYGAVLLSENLNENDFVSFCNCIYKNIFDKAIVYEDILLRDYALNIIEYAKYLNYNFKFDIQKCRPPYKSANIKSIDSSIEDYFKFSFESNTYTGSNSINSSIIPNIDGGYGDFGRYVFESALDYFENIDLKNLYYYALNIIRNELGYDNELFSEYDVRIHRNQSYDRHNTNKIERIGKKYQWIAFYKILAIVSDHNKLKTKYSDRISNTYKGSWDPYVRDFDPTLRLINREKTYSIPITLSQPEYSNWDNQNPEWANYPDDVMDFDKYIEVKDDADTDWIILHGSFKRVSSDDYKNDYQEVWRMLNCYFIKKDDFSLFFNYIKDTPLWGRWFSESRERYNIFSHEYYWSPAYKDEYGNELLEVDIKTTETKKIPLPTFYTNLNANNESIEEYSVISEFKTFTNIMPSWNEYLWEEQYDASKEDVVSYCLPCSQIINTLNIIQKENGLFYINDELVAIDFSLIKGTTEGLYIKKNLFMSFIEQNELIPFWICVGEKNDIKKENQSKANSQSVYKDMSSFVYYSIGKLTSINFFGDRRNY